MIDRLSPTDPTTRVLARVTTAKALAEHLADALDSTQDPYIVKGALEAIAATAIARAFYLEAQNCRLLEGEKCHDQATGVPVLPPLRSARAPAPGHGTSGPLNNFRREVDKLGLGPWRGHVENVVQISDYRTSTESLRGA